MSILNVGLIPVWLFEDPDTLKALLETATIAEDVEELTRELQLRVDLSLQIVLRRGIASGITEAFGVSPTKRESQRHVLERVTGKSSGQVNRILRSVGLFSNSEQDRQSDTNQLLTHLQARDRGIQQNIYLETLILLALASGEEFGVFIGSPPHFTATLASRILSGRVAGSQSETELQASERMKREYPILESRVLVGALDQKPVPPKAKMACYGLYLWQASGLMFSEGWSADRIDEALRRGGRWAKNYFTDLVPLAEHQESGAPSELPSRLASIFRTCGFEVAEQVGRALCGLPPYTRPLREQI